ncbi:hypothetical protein ACLOJK_008418 [Asimina triloba]
MLKEEKGKIEGLQARVQLQNLPSLLVSASSLLVPSVTGAPASASDGFFEILLANPKWMGFVAADKGVEQIHVFFLSVAVAIRNFSLSNSFEVGRVSMEMTL